MRDRFRHTRVFYSKRSTPFVHNLFITASDDKNLGTSPPCYALHKALWEGGNAR